MGLLDQVLGKFSDSQQSATPASMIDQFTRLFNRLRGVERVVIRNEIELAVIVRSSIPDAGAIR